MSERPTCIFLPGIIAPAVVRYAPLVAELGPQVDSRTKELELYTLTPPPGDYAIEDEVAAPLGCARRAGVDRFHLYGHSAGGAVALAFAAAHPHMVLSLALDEPAFDFSDEMRGDLAAHLDLLPRLREDPSQAMRQFLALELRPGVEVAPPPGITPLPNRPAGIATLL